MEAETRLNNGRKRGALVRAENEDGAEAGICQASLLEQLMMQEAMPEKQWDRMRKQRWRCRAGKDEWTQPEADSYSLTCLFERSPDG